MKTMTKSAFGVWTGTFLVEHCPYEHLGCESGGCWAAGLCRDAHARQTPGLWAGLVAEDRREDRMWLVLALACLGLVILAFV